VATAWKYLPILKWKQGERIALRNLTETQWNGVVPLVELLPIVATPDAAGLKAALPSYLDKLGKEMAAALLEHASVAVDIRYLAPAYPNQARLADVVCKKLAADTDLNVIPVITQSMLLETPNEVGKLAAFPEQILRVVAPFTQAESITQMVKALVAAGLPKKSLHVLIDQFSIVGEAAPAKWTAVRPYLDVAMSTACASTTLAGGSFPINLIGMAQGVKDLPRVEWLIWKLLRRAPEYRTVRFSDYTVSNPAMAPDMDPLQINPSIHIRYAADSLWRVFKAGGFKKGKPNQLKNLCKLLLGDTVYSGQSFSFGDGNYHKQANDPSTTAKNGNPSSWRRDATNHHVVLTATAL
jgi:hypothetical protein